MIRAECHSDDRVFVASFNATPFFQEATDKQIVDLAACGWRGDYPADTVAWHVSELTGYEEVVRVLDYPTRLKNMGFECSVEPKDALAWLATHRPQTLALVKAAVLEATGEWEDPEPNAEQGPKGTLLPRDEGWAVFDSHGEVRELRIEKIDELDVFATDGDAWNHVVSKARGGSEPHRQALAEVSDAERQRILEHCGAW